MRHTRLRCADRNACTSLSSVLNLRCSGWRRRQHERACNARLSALDDNARLKRGESIGVASGMAQCWRREIMAAASTRKLRRNAHIMRRAENIASNSMLASSALSWRV